MKDKTVVDLAQTHDTEAVLGLKYPELMLNNL